MALTVNFPNDAPVRPEKREALRRRIAALGLDLGAVDEQAIRSSGPGGQKVNKTSSGVLLRLHRPDGDVVVKWTTERHWSLNRYLALRRLVDELEERASGGARAQSEAERARRRKDRARRRGKGQREPSG
ncbi:MAG: peptide chain release factor family protein [Deltaproteobacteria bacterium]